MSNDNTNAKGEELTPEQLQQIGAILVSAVSEGGGRLKEFDNWYRDAVRQAGHQLDEPQAKGDKASDKAKGFALPDEDYASDNEKAIAQFVGQLGAMIEELNATVQQSFAGLEDGIRNKMQFMQTLPQLREKTGLDSLTAEDVEAAMRETGIQHPYYALVEKYNLKIAGASSDDAPTPNGSAFDIKSISKLDKWDIAKVASNPKAKDAVVRALNDRREALLKQQLEEGKVVPPGTNSTAQTGAGSEGA